MEQQLSLFTETLPPVIPAHAVAGESLADRFQRFHAQNPHVYGELRRLALQLKRAGARKGGMKMLFENLRWQYALQTRGEDFKLNNIYTAPYARLLMEKEPELAGFFETRESEADQ